MATPKLNIAKFLKDTSSGGLNLSVEKAANGLILNINTNLVDNTSAPAVSESQNRKYVFSGDAVDIKADIEAELGLGILFE